jgi:hypothetical protein
MSGGLGLEQRYRRVLRLLPGYYRDRWEEDMVGAFLDSWLTGDPKDDDAILEFCKRTWPEVASVAGLAALAQAQVTGIMPAPFGPWAWWVLFNLALVLAMTAFHQDAPPPARPPWLLALPAGYLLVIVPLMVAQATGNAAWVPDFSGLCCLLAALACLARAPRAWSRRSAGLGVWSLALVLLAAVAGAYRVVTLAGYAHDPHLFKVSLAELVIVVAAAALVAPDAARAQAGMPAPPYPGTIAA